MSALTLISTSAVAPSAALPKPLSLEERFVAEWMAARADGDSKRIKSLRMFARSVDGQLPTLLAELDGFNYPAAA
ncbi:hypothetical protein ACFV90_36820 [Streptomyces sp. NPDC059904]|uniref:hypothetical protein n=1 Tax=Streptomyces sp. NPDC059904 TaxID=3346996 RepID=UPI00365AE39F